MAILFQSENPQLNDSINQLKPEFKEGNLTISQIVEKPNVQASIVNILSDQNVRVEIHNQIQKPEIMDEINSLREDKDLQDAANTLMSNPEISNYVFMIIYGEDEYVPPFKSVLKKLNKILRFEFI